MNNPIYRSHDNFMWLWDFNKKDWILDIERSGGPPSPHKPAPKKPEPLMYSTNNSMSKGVSDLRDGDFNEAMQEL